METPQLLDISAEITTFFGIFFAIFSSLMNIFNLKKIEKKKKNDMVLFYSRFIFDAFYGITVTIFLSLMIAANFNNLETINHFTLLSGLLVWNVGISQAVVALMISIERNMAIFTPIFYRNHRSLVTNSVILCLIFGYAIFQYSFIYYFCNFELTFPRNCLTIGCSINACSSRFWTKSKLVIFVLTFSFAALLSSKLLWKVFKKDNKDFNKANLLALIDAAIIFLFDFLSIVFFNFTDRVETFSIHNIGPFATSLKQVGCTIEALLVYRTITKKNYIVKIFKKCNVITNKQPTS
ncbi:Serpentine Receptor, class BC (Class B-like) [Caenorhabditis elegans]|uniref:Serpentine Receptor, class BC (Class B-like) n=1 Tax=Caenorhabditis elegans TaxID=6239 RepID=O44695_CAEEL|nr:Serpentine Receptor, class BC (Class B-like) [Caenorhabditis elegans]CCD67418.1 Serpentine Receptor, class BC (Class B-like) [Caenorhabditis elegans]|eukprot:NP_503583.2 Serpentine Receptor, class BC (class B-like) [Caenorhabditis elegans]